MTTSMLEITDLHKKFGKRTILRNANLQLQASDRLTIAGRSGEGKTTLLRLIAGLEVPDQGEIRLHGQTATLKRKLHLAPHQRKVQMVFQDLALWPSRTVLQNVTDGLRCQGVDKPTAQDRAKQALERLGIADLGKRKPSHLSGGEARRLAFARVLALQPSLLLLDEPFASLDPVARSQGFEFLEEVLNDSQAAVILVTHEPSEARALGGHVALLKNGELHRPVPHEEICGSDQQFLEALAQS